MTPNPSDLLRWWELMFGLDGEGCPHNSPGTPSGALELPQPPPWRPRACPDSLPQWQFKLQALLGWAPLTDAVVTHVVVSVVTLLPGLQDAIPAGAVVVYVVVHRIERSQLAKETHHSYQVQLPGRAAH